MIVGSLLRSAWCCFVDEERAFNDPVTRMAPTFTKAPTSGFSLAFLCPMNESLRHLKGGYLPAAFPAMLTFIFTPSIRMNLEKVFTNVSF